VLLLITEYVFAGVRNWLELPAALVATTTNCPYALALVVRLILAEFPVGSIKTDRTVIGTGINAGKKENVEAVRLAPVMEIVLVVFAKPDLGDIEVMTGLAVTTKSVLEVTVAPATVIEIRPVAALLGTLAISIVLFAEETVAATPLKRTVFADAVEPKPCPRIVTGVKGPPWPGEKLKMLSAAGFPIVRFTWIMFPTGS
jgi:hypothetical protein